MNIVFSSRIESPERWLPLLERALPRDRFFAWPDVNGGDAEVALVATPHAGLFATLPNLKLVQSIWMGVDPLLADPDFPRNVALARCIDPGMVAAMCETVLAHVIDFHRGLYLYRRQQAGRQWKKLPQYMAADRTVGLLGLGELGSAVGAMLHGLGFGVCGWSRRPKRVAGVEGYAGDDGLAQMLQRCNIVICLLPLTAQTRGILNADRLALLPQGSAVVNLARGGHVVDADLLAALDSGRIAQAYLDVFATEPLPADHRYWTHPGVVVTPHIAALTEPRTALPMIVENINRVRDGRPPAGLVDVGAGY